MRERPVWRPIWQITIPATDHKSLFCMRVPKGRYTHEAIGKVRLHWDDAWKSIGVEKSPMLLIIEEGTELTPLSDAELRNIGLMRIPTDAARSETT